MTTTFYEKLDLIAYISVPTNRNDFKELIEQIWEYLLEMDLSVVVKDGDGDVVAISLNNDGQDPPNITADNWSLCSIFDFLDSFETPIL